MNNQDYKFTGKQVPIKLDELLTHVFKQLFLYDKGELKVDPRTTQITYTTAEGKMIQIPTQIQEAAIKQWKEKKTEQEIEQKYKQEPIKKIKIKKNSWIYYICIIITLIISY